MYESKEYLQILNHLYGFNFFNIRVNDLVTPVILGILARHTSMLNSEQARWANSITKLSNIRLQQQRWTGSATQAFRP